jgi:hypothetical protein
MRRRVRSRAHAGQRPVAGEAGDQGVDLGLGLLDPEDDIDRERVRVEDLLAHQLGRRLALGLGLVEQPERPFPGLPPLGAHPFRRG